MRYLKLVSSSLFLLLLWLNPTSTTARITYTIPNKGTGVLTILNLNGKIMQEIQVNGSEEATEVDVTQYPAGMYIYNLSAANYKSITKTLIVR